MVTNDKKMKVNLKLILILLLSVNIISCKKDKKIIKVDVSFDYSAENNNMPKFWSTSINPAPTKISLYYLWDFGLDSTFTGMTAEPTFDFPGKYPVKLRVTTSEGVQSYNKKFYYTVEKINPKLKENPYLHNLTMDKDGNESKKWVLSTAKGGMSIGKSDGIENGKGIDYINDAIKEDTEYPANYLKQFGDEAYDNKMEFMLNRYKYKNISNSKWIVNWYFANEEFGYSQDEGKDICINIGSNLDTLGYFKLKENDNGTMFIELSGQNFMIYYEGKPSNIKYQVLALYNDLLIIRKPYFNKDGDYAGYRMLKYVPEENQNKPLPTNYIMRVINPPHKYE